MSNTAIEFKFKDFKKKQNYSIDASAGTGKTYNIKKIVASLVSGDDKLPIEKLLIVTYTEKAVGELKDRIRDELEEQGISANIENANIVTIHSFCQNTIKEFGVYVHTPSKLTVVDEKLVEEFAKRFIRKEIYENRIAISTKTKINSLTETVIKLMKKMYFDSEGVPVDSVVRLEDCDEEECFLFDLITNINRLKTEEEGVSFLKNSMHQKYDRYYTKLKTAIDTIPNIKPYQDAYDAEVKNQAAIDKEWAELKDKRTIEDDKLKELKAKKATLAGAEKKAIDVEIKAQNAIIDFLKEEKKRISEEKNRIKDLVSDKKKELNYSCFAYNLVRGIKANDEIHIYSEYGDDFFALHPELLYVKELSQKKVNKLVEYAGIAGRLYKEWQEEKRRNRWQTFDDMIRSVRDAVLSNDALVTKLREKYTYAIIDEFQDTNQLQWDIFKKVFLDSDTGNKIIVVGDPKQSIYSFQGADKYVYDAAVKEIGDNGGIQCKLVQNRRSTPNLVDAYNRLFHSKYFDSLNYSDVDAVRKNDKEHYIYATYENKLMSGITFIKGETDYINDKDYAINVVEFITDCCTKNNNGKTKVLLNDKDNVSFKDFTVLIRGKKEFPVFQRAFENAGIPYVRVKDTSLFEGTECAQWRVLFEALIQPDFTNTRRKYFKKLMFTKFFGRTLAEISNPYFDKDDTDEMHLVLDWIALARDRKYDELIDAVLSGSNIEKRMSSLTEIQSLSVFKQIGEYALGYLLNNHSISELIDNLDQSGNLDEDEDSPNIVAKNTDFDSVRIMTIHASKGLDAPIIITSLGTPIKDQPVYEYHKTTDNAIERIVTLQPDNAIKELEQEEQRLYYVAYTRAKYHMVIPYSDGARKVLYEDVINNPNNELFSIKEHQNGKTIDDVIRNKVQAIIQGTKSNVIDPVTEEEQMKEIQSLIKHKGSKASYKHSYSSLTHGKEDKNITINDVILKDQEDEKTEESLAKYDPTYIPIDCEYHEEISDNNEPEGFPKGSVIGTTLHEIFEKYDYTLIEKDTTKLNSLIKECFKNNGYLLQEDNPKHQEYLAYVNTMVHHVLLAKFPKIHGSKDIHTSFTLSTLTNENKKPEAEFNFNLKISKDAPAKRLSNYCNGFIDLLFKDGEYYSILDWKSDKKRDPIDNKEKYISYATKESLMSHVNEEYAIQRVLYSYCLIQWLKNFYKGSEEEIFEQHFGGVYYVFIRGCNKGTGNGIYAHTWNSYKDLEQAFYTIIKEKLGGKH